MLEKIPENQRFDLLKIQGKLDRTILHLAVEKGFEGLAIRMLEKAPENQRFDLLKIQGRLDRTILHLAVEKGFEGLAIKMLEKMPENQRFDLLKIQGRLDRTILHLAVEKGFEGLAIKMLEKMPDDKIVEDIKDILNLAKEKHLDNLVNKIRLIQRRQYKRIALKVLPFIILGLGLGIGAYSKYLSTNEDK